MCVRIKLQSTLYDPTASELLKVHTGWLSIHAALKRLRAVYRPKQFVKSNGPCID